MASYATLKATIQQNIKQNGANGITGNLLQQQLLAMINSLGAGYQYMGVATPSTNPGTPDQKVFYIAATPGIYTNFDGFSVPFGQMRIFKYDTQWTMDNLLMVPPGGMFSCRTGGSSAEKIVDTASNVVMNQYTHGVLFIVNFSNGNAVSSGVTLNFGGVVRTLNINGQPVSAVNTWAAGDTFIVYGTPSGSTWNAFSLQAEAKLKDYMLELFIIRKVLENKLFGFNGTFATLHSSTTANTNYVYYIVPAINPDYKKIAYHNGVEWILTNYTTDDAKIFVRLLNDKYDALRPCSSSQVATEAVRRFGGALSLDLFEKRELNIISTGQWSNINNTHIAVYCKGIAKIRLVGGGVRETYYSFVKSYILPVYGDAADICANTDNRYTLGANSTIDVNIPADCAWLIMTTKLAAGDSAPSEIYVYGETTPGAIDDNTTSLTKTWSSQKISDEIGNAVADNYDLDSLVRTGLAQVVKYNKASLLLNVAFVTDTHANKDTHPDSVGSFDASPSIRAMREIGVSKTMDMLVHCGDIITTSDATSYDLNALLEDVLAHLNKFKSIDNLVFVKGNHDNGHQKEVGQDNGNISNDQFKMLYQQGPAYNGAVFGSENGAAYFYKDFDDKKIRVIVLDSWYDWAMADNSDYMSFGAAQENWLYTEALNMSDKSGWSVIVFSHYFGYSQLTIEQNPLSENVTNIFRAFQDKGTTYGGYTFSPTMNVLLVGVIMGHQHSDAYNNTMGFNTIRVTRGYATDEEIGTNNAVCVDVFTVDTTNHILYETRIGRGASRSYSYGANPQQLT